ncbi:MAG: molybdopterin adenylyltransferase, partial [Verrucomicrobiaceae bacterium]
VLIPDEQAEIESTLRRLCDEDHCHLILTTGGTGPAPRDVTPEATRAVIERELPGFGEIMRVQSFAKVKTSILSRSTAGTRGKTLIVNLPGNPRAIGECLPLVMPAIAEALRHISGEVLQLRG